MTTKNVSTKDYAGREFLITREFAAPRELVFAAWADPKHLMQWWGPKGFTNPICEWDARPGKEIHVVMRAPNGVEYPMGGAFREILPPERLVFTSGALDENGKLLFEILHTVTFEERPEKTVLTIKSRVTKTSPGAGNYISGFEPGMTQSLERLATLLTQTKAVVVERTFDAPIATIWKAITDKSEMKQWYFDLPEFKPEVGFEFQFVAGSEGVSYVHLCKIVEVIAREKLVHTWRYEGYEGDSLVTFELFPEGNRTRLKLTHAGLESFPKTPAFARTNFMEGWTSIIGTNLKKFVENLSAENESGLGTETKESSDREIVITRTFSAPRELVWQAMTEPQHVVNWWGPRGFTTTIETMDVRPGGVWKHVMRGPDRKNYPNKSIFKEVVKPERIVYSHSGGREKGPGVHFTSMWTFDAVNAKETKVTIRMIFSSEADREFVVKEFGAIEGGKQTLARLAEYLPKMALA
jgi:uncharacterized protein YndB with AHSA1/START domain